MTNETQIIKIIKQLNKTGRVSRNWCLQRYITRLASHISSLKNAGWIFSAGYDIYPEGMDYVYVLTSKPKKK